MSLIERDDLTAEIERILAERYERTKKVTFTLRVSVCKSGCSVPSLRGWRATMRRGGHRCRDEIRWERMSAR
jgi:hypothetical protein